MRPSISILGTGGTIASTQTASGATPSKRSEELVSAIPQLNEYADLTVREVVQRPSFTMDFEAVDELREAIRQEIENGVNGVIVTHGTDTMEESAYLLDLTLESDVPVVFTGAQRSADELSADGPSNLMTAVRLLTDERLLAAGGVYIAFDEKLHAARDVTKRHTHALDTFSSPDKGPIAVLTRETIRMYRSPGSYSDSLELEDVDAPATVRTVKSGLGVDSAQLEDAIAADVDGIVLEGTGLGNATTSLGNVVEQAIDAGIPVVVTSRCYAGSTAPVYGTAGGGQTLASHGARHGDDLSTHKARLKLQLVLAQTETPTSLDRYFGASTYDSQQK
ncbi:L-asparaginase [Halogranum amylolyticum]|uniref:L-asparaginase n=1 Tax=Halogranum amylolyticum TaxID=660520 RepID=A0A1H8MTC6_9EURY|nr:asparaginase [Halogranum amylolyticum]SEO20416.1 L-asparaginase [Halogranum amylolyticum]